MGRTLEQLIDSYRTDPDSDFLKLKYQVRTKHDGELTRLLEKHGRAQLRDIQLRMLTAWYRDALADGKIAKARSLVSRLRELFRFGRLFLEDGDCHRLFEVLRKLQLDMSPPRRVEMTADHARAICKTAREHFGWHSIALAQALQFELLLGQKDVIGEWVPVGEPGESDVVQPGKKWLRGLRWSGIDDKLILSHQVGSGQRPIEADLRTAPMVTEELQWLAGEGPLVVAGEATEKAMINREFLPASGPVIICDTTGMPWSTPEFRRKWRLVAKKAGVPDNVTNRDSLPTGMIRGGPDRAEIRQKYSLKRIDYSLRMARRFSEDSSDD
ncbi:hypothetical protein [Bradyrhizobium sp. JYMT SZCCT0428]|uniref:hypothetical protein n=1 Tax=Bradyrhizobium sp. JYMT SZCCT0428 TaxID=2807673 RepID=UPI001BA56152|nr:hypothetical protein [Bradyrhizobium sp. JYMT SZCCT0428]MBR1149965.1 hypothetical protein [Bradyrhizobium sp. JYMT SZCCT0428]